MQVVKLHKINWFIFALSFEQTVKDHHTRKNELIHRFSKVPA